MENERSTKDTSGSNSKKIALIAVILAALVLRIADFPSRYVKRDFDERPYAQGGLALWEGITPTYSYAPDGPLVWIGWTYAAAESAKYVLFPSPEERAVSFALRPFTAGNHALFDLYRDWSLLRWADVAANAVVAVLAAAAAFQLGWKRGGLIPALLLGGMAAVLPLFVELSSNSRPYAMAWGFGIISLYFAAVAADRPRAVRWSAIFMGLAVASRIDMLLLLPVAWADIWYVAPTFTRRIARIIGFTLLAAMVSLLVSPWLLTNLIGNLRAIVTVRIAEPTSGPVSIAGTLIEIIVHQGLAVDLLLILCAMVLVSPDKQKIRWAAAGYVLLLSISMLKGTGFGLRHQGAPVVALVAFSAVGMAALARRWPRLAAVALVAALAPATIASIVGVVQRRNLEVNDHATQWVQRHVPSGTLVYLSPGIHDPLPTAAASNALWSEVNDNNAWTKKLDSAMKRFHATGADYPHAFSETNMVVEKGLHREWFILGSRTFLPDPRYDIRIISESIVFSIWDISAQFKKTGGVLICNDFEGAMPTDLGTPVIQWTNSHGQGVRIYCSPDVMKTLIDPQDLQDW